MSTMGQLWYGTPPAVFEFDDRTLAHLELVTIAKLRRNEHFAFSIDGAKAGRTTIWIGTNSTIQFHFDVSDHEISRRWLEDLMDSANSTGGLRVVPEEPAS